MEQAKFLRNQWYVAGRTEELGGDDREAGARLLGRTIMNEPIVFFRRKDGSVAALEDRCPHRKYALSKGVVLGDELQCGYHGVQLDGSGKCTKVPSQVNIPRGFGARAYPVAEKHTYLWVWMGDPALADPNLIYDWHWNDDPGWKTVHGYHHVKGDYQLLIDNLLDLTHLTLVHKTTLSGPGIMENPLKVWTDGDALRSLRDIRNVMPAPINTLWRNKPGQPIDRIQETEFKAPGYISIVIRANPAGSNVDTPQHVVINNVIPETDDTTHYFWGISRCGALDDQTVDAMYKKMLIVAFDEDVAVVDRQHRNIVSDPSDRPLAYFEGDEAALQARRIMGKKLAEEAKSHATA